MSRRIINLGAAIRADEAERMRQNDAWRARQDQPRKPLARPRTPISIEISPEELAGLIHEHRIAREEPIAILMGFRELRAFRRVPGARDYLEIWPGGEETFARVPLICRKGAGQPRIFVDLADLDAECTRLPQPYLPGAHRR